MFLTLFSLVLIRAKIIYSSSQALFLLLALEFLTLTTILGVQRVARRAHLSSTLIFTVYTLAVCEASLGLGLLIKSARVFGQPTLVF